MGLNQFTSFLLYNLLYKVAKQGMSHNYVKVLYLTGNVKLIPSIGDIVNSGQLERKPFKS